MDCAACRARGIAVIRRVTGGRAVLHDAEVTYSVCAPAGLPGFGTGLDEAYRQIAAGLIAGLRQLGLEASLPSSGSRGPSRENRPAGCFASTARHEIVVGGRKLVGSAQRRRAGAFLQHGSILLQGHGALLEQTLRGPAPGAGARMVALAELLHPGPTPQAIVDAVVGGFSDAWGASFLPGQPSGAEQAEARGLAAGRYRSEDWNGRLR